MVSKYETSQKTIIDFFFFFGDINILKSLLFQILYNLCFLLTPLDKNPRAATALRNMQNKKTGNDGYMAMKLDKSKAYDRVE